MEKVLVVDDEANIRKLVSVNLSSRGYQVLEATNGSEALAQLHANHPALMVLDIKLPDFSGWDLLKQIKTDPRIAFGFPVIVITASITGNLIDLGTYPNVVEILTKPFSTARLVSAVEQTLGYR